MGKNTDIILFFAFKDCRTLPPLPLLPNLEI